MKWLSCFFIFSIIGLAQPASPVRKVAIDPSGSCNQSVILNSIASGNSFYCDPKTNLWAQLNGGSGGGTRDENLYSSVAAKNINGVGAAVWSCISNCGVPDVSLFVGSEAGAVLNLTSVTTPTAQDQFVLPGGYNNQMITVEMHYFTSIDTNTGHSGTWTLTAVCGVEIINPTFAAAGGAVSLPGIATSTQEAVVTTTFTPSGCAAGTRMAIKSTWSQGTLTYLGVVALRLHATF